MSIRIIESAVVAEQSDELHVARLLLLARGAHSLQKSDIDGITKLAKMDFLLRYPMYLQRVLAIRYKRPRQVAMESYEVNTVESRMIRFRYGPWDARYRRWIGILVARGLAVSFLKGRAVHVGATVLGLEVAERIAQRPEFELLSRRALQVAGAVGDLGGTKLKDMIYKVVPELVGVKWGEEIDQ